MNDGDEPGSFGGINPAIVAAWRATAPQYEEAPADYLTTAELARYVWRCSDRAARERVRRLVETDSVLIGWRKLSGRWVRAYKLKGAK